MKYSTKTIEAISRWQLLRESNYLRARDAIEKGNLYYATCFQELQALCHIEVIKHMQLED